jgi:hypothetical protein
MKWLWASSLGLSLSCGAALAAADEPQWRPAAPLPAAATVPHSVGVTLGRPVPRAPDTPVIVDSQVRPTSYVAPTSAPAPFIARGRSADDPLPSPPPLWPTVTPYAMLPEPSAIKSASLKVASEKPDPDPPPGTFAAPPPTPLAGSTAVPLHETSGPLVHGAAPSLKACGEAVSGDECTCCGEACCTRPGHRLYGSAEYLLWSIKDSHFPVLVTSGPTSSNGFLSNPSTVVLFGGGDVENDLQSGGRFTLGYWLDACETNGIEASFFFLGERSIHFSANSGTTPLIARPFFNLSTGMESSEITALPGLATGSINIRQESELWGAEANWRHRLCDGCWYRVDLLAGFRYVELDEDLQVSEDFTTSPTFGQIFPNAPEFANSRFQVFDRFQTRNQFYGGQVGFDTELRRGKWSLDLSTKVALGFTHQVVNITGSEFVTFPGGRTQEFQGGLLALSSNIGHHARERFAVVPEAGLTVGYQLTEKLKLFAGYNFMFWSNVVRPGEQIDRQLDPRRIPNFCKISPAECPRGPIVPPRPEFAFRETTFWAQGLTAGLELKY